MSLRFRAGIRRLIAQDLVHLPRQPVALVFRHSTEPEPDMLLDRRPIVAVTLGGLETDGREGKKDRMRLGSIVHI